MGTAYQLQNRSDSAIKAYRTASNETQDDELKTLAERQIAILSADK